MRFIGRTPYFPAVIRHAKAHRQIEKMQQDGLVIQPVMLVGRDIADSFWGKGWCEHIESFRDYANKLSDGRISVRNGSVGHLEIAQGRIEALVTGTSLYSVTITVEKYPEKKWDALKFLSSGRILLMTDLLSGNLDRAVKECVTNRRNGLFPLQLEMRFKCDCPDRVAVCKHVAAVLYAVGARLDNSPEQIFLLRGVNYEELVGVPAVRTLAIRPVAPVRGISETVSLPDPLTGNDIIAWRTSIGLAQDAFAVQINLSLTTVLRWEKVGVNTLKVHSPTLIKLRKAWELTHK